MEREPSVYAAFAYDAATLLIQALDERYLTHELIMAQDKRDSVHRELRDFIRSIDIRKPRFGLSGKICFNAQGNVLRDGIIASLEQNVGGKKAVTFAPQFKGVLKAEAFSNSTGLPEKRANWSTPLVWPGIKLTRVNNVRMVDRTFDAEFYLWFEGTLEDLAQWRCWGRDPKELRKFLVFPDVVRGTGKDADRDGLAIEVLPETVNVAFGSGAVRYLCRGRFRSDYNLEEYPDDRQFFRIQVLLPKVDPERIRLWPNMDALFRPEPHDIPTMWSFVPGSTKLSTAGVLMELPPAKHSAISKYRIMGGSPETRILQQAFTATFFVARKTDQYRWTIFYPLVLLTLVGVIALIIPARRFEVRISLGITALLAIIVHHLSQLQPIRATGQSTYADTLYVIAYLTILCVVVTVIYIQIRFSKQRDKNIRALSRNLSEPPDSVIITNAETNAEKQFWGWSAALFVALLCLLAVFLGRYIIPCN